MSRRLLPSPPAIAIVFLRAGARYPSLIPLAGVVSIPGDGDGGAAVVRWLRRRVFGDPHFFISKREKSNRCRAKSPFPRPEQRVSVVE